MTCSAQKTLPFSIYSGCGNTFVLVDNRSEGFSREPTEIQALSSENNCDGLILLERSHRADVKMRIYNCDGSEAEMCGNGIRCLLKFMVDLGFGKKGYTIETMHDFLRTSFVGEEIQVDMGKPKIHSLHIPLEGETLHFLDTGIPHAVLFTTSLDAVDVEQLGPLFRHHPYFGPAGTNVTFVEIVSENELRFATYERGVEGETSACGTGATAAALAAHLVHHMESPLSVRTRLGEQLTIHFEPAPPSFKRVTMTGPAKKLPMG